VTDGDIPLDITGHEERERPGDSPDESGLPTDGASPAEPDEADGASPSKNGDSPTDDHPSENGDSPMDGAGEGSEDVEPVEVLVQLAEDGEIDPWDIDIVEVTDKFLERLDEAALRESGRALFYASVLLRMKSDALLEPDEPDDEEPEPWEQLAGDEPLAEPDPFATLEQEMDRRLERKRARGMPQTLDELVRDLREAERETWWKESREYDTSDSPGGFDRGTQELDYRRADQFRMDDEPTEEDVTGNTHGEDIETIIDDVYTTVREHYDQGRKEVLFREIESAGETRVQTYLGLLFLSHSGQIRLRQDELFGDLWIQDPAAVAGSGEAVAD
jgi:segregation and condensation protein A